MIKKRHVPALDGVRGVAALAVFVFHYGGGAQSHAFAVRAVGYLVKFGAAGVSLFFVLSGFLIGGILWDGYAHHGWWKNFYARRSLRIFPLYYFVIALAVVISLFFHDSWLQIRSFWPYLLYLQNMPFSGPVLAHAPTHLKFYHFWSLAVEEQFYLVWPFILWPFRGRIRSAQAMCLTVWAASLGYRIWLWHAGLLQWDWSVPSHAGELSLGTFLALSMRESQEKWDRILRWAPAVFLAALAGVCLDAWFGWKAHVGELHTYPTTVFGFAIYAVFFASIVVLCFRPGIVRWWFNLPPFRFAGKISYGIYVYHVALMPFYYKLLSPLASRASHNVYQGIVFCVAFSVTIAVASLSFYGFERQVSRLKKYFPTDAGVPASIEQAARSADSAAQTISS